MQSGHAEFGQPSFPQQYAFATQMSAVPNNPTHDMNKQVQAAQPGMYSTNSGGIPGAGQQHHQQGMGGPAPSPQPSSLVQQGQPINRQHMTNLAFYPRPGGPRSLPNINRNSITNVVNPSGQQTTQQFGQIQMMPSHTQFHSTIPHQMIMAPSMAQMYNTRHPYTQQPYQVISPTQAVYMNPAATWNSYNPAPQNTNGYYPPPHMQSYNTMTTQMTQMPAQTQKPEKKIIKIIDPKTGKNVLDDLNDSGSSCSSVEKEVETADSDISVQFAAQVAAIALTSEGKREPLPKSLNIEDRVSVDTQQSMVLSSSEINIEENIEEAENGELNDIEQYDDRNIPCPDESISCYKKEIELNSVIDNYVYESEKTVSDSVEPISLVESEDSNEYNTLTDNTVGYSDSISIVKSTSIQALDTTPLPDSSESDMELVKNFDALDVSMLPPSPQAAADDAILSTPEDVDQPPMQVNEMPTMEVIVQETKTSPSNGEISEASITSTNSIAKSEEKPPSESRKNKGKKKKDLNKRGESKEGGEMDAFIDKGEEVVTPTAPPEPAAPIVVSPTYDERLPSPVPILDSEILKTIPLPDEIMPPPPNDVSPAEPLSESSLSPSVENDDKENIIEDVPNKIVLKYSYKEDQWSPLNPEGKKQYDRDFLLHLQSQPMSMRKPTNLPNLDVIKDKANIHRLNEVNRAAPMTVQVRTYNDPFMPVYARGGGAPRPPHPIVNRRSQQGGRDKPKKVISFASSLNQAVKLHESENAWKPSCKSDGPTDQDNLEIMELHKKVRGILNKLTPQKFSTLVDQVRGLEITTEERLNGVIDLVFEKAIDEPNFSVPYANMCKQLAKIQVPLAGQPGQFVNFRKLLLTKCQKEFEQDRCDELKREDQMKAIETAENEEKRKVLQSEFDEEEKKTRYRQLGNIRFIGELFKLGMLIEPIMHECIKKLLTQGDEESLECLCRLLKTIGKELDESKKSPRDTVMDVCFNDMQKVVDKRLTSSRVRFMLQDVIDLKKNNWIPRRDENNPKTIDQIHKEAEREAHEQQQILQNVSSYPKRMPDDRDRRKGNSGRNMGVSEDGWTPSKSNKGGYSVVDPTKLKLTKPAEVESIHLGPGGRGLSSWAKGSSGGTKNTSGESDSKSMLTNRYSALADQSMTSNYEGRRGAQRSAASSRESSRGRNNQLPPPVRKTPSTSKERESLLETVKGLARGNTTEQKAPEVKKPPEAHINGKDSTVVGLRGPEMSEEEIEKKIKPLIDEFLHNNDSEEAIKCIMELASPSTIHMFVYAAVNQVLERSSQARYLLGQLLYSLVKKNLITVEQFNKGFKCVLEFIDDYALDIPLIWDYLGEILEAMVEEQKLPLTFLKEVLQPCIPSLNAGKLVCAVLHCAAKKRGTVKLGEIWRESGLQWSDFLSSDVTLPDFIQSNKLDFTIRQAKIQPNVELNMIEIKKHLEFLLSKSDDMEGVFDWIEGNVGGNRITEPSFIRALVTAVHENAITDIAGKCELDPLKLKKRILLLTRYIDHNENLELQTLYAIQALVNQLNHPKGILRQIFDILYDDDVITDEAFKQWELSTDPAEQEGKAVALQCVGPFFTWLREGDESVDADDESAGED